MDRRITGVIMYMVLGAALLLLAGCEDLLFLSQLEEIAGKGEGVVAIEFNGDAFGDGDTIRHGWMAEGAGEQTYYFQLRNDGVKTLRIESCWLDNTYDYVLNATFPMDLPPDPENNSVELSFTFTGSSGPGSKSSKLVVNSSSPDGPMELTLQGQVFGRIGSIGGVSGPISTDMAVRGDFVYITIDDGNFGTLICIDTSDKYTFGAYPENFNDLGTMRPRSIAINGRYAYVGLMDGGVNFLVFDLDSDPMSPVLLNNIYIGSNVTELQISGGYLYMAHGNALEIWSLQNPAMPYFVGGYTTETDSSISAIGVYGNYAYIAIQDIPTPAPDACVVRAINVSNKNAPAPGNSSPLTSSGNAIGFFPGRMAVSCSGTYARLYNIGDPATPNYMGDEGFNYIFGTDICVASPYLYLGTGAGISIFNIDDPMYMFLRTTMLPGSQALFIRRSGDFLYVLDGGGNLNAVSYPTY